MTKKLTKIVLSQKQRDKLVAIREGLFQINKGQEGDFIDREQDHSRADDLLEQAVRILEVELLRQIACLYRSIEKDYA